MYKEENENNHIRLSGECMLLVFSSHHNNDFEDIKALSESQLSGLGQSML